MNRAQYREEYLHSEHWLAMRVIALERAEHRCQICNKSESLDVHHRTYERLGSERPSDLTVLCRKCYALFHSKGRLKSLNPPKPKAYKPKKVKQKIMALAEQNETLHKHHQDVKERAALRRQKRKADAASERINKELRT